MTANVVDLLRVQAQERPDTPAIIDARRGRTVTFRQLFDQAAKAARALRERGVRHSDGVLVLHGMAIELYVFLAAIFQIGAVAMFIDPAAKASVIAQGCAMERPVALFGSAQAQLWRLRYPALRSIPHRFSAGAPLLRSVGWQQMLRLEPYREIEPVSPDAPALLTFTSGSTGAAKGAVRSHGVLRAQLERLRESLALQAGTIDLTTMPIVLLANLACGVTSVLSSADVRRPGNVDAARLVADVQRYAVTSTVASPALLDRLAAHCEISATRLPGLHAVHCGGAPVFPRLLDRIAGFAPNARVSAVYGSTEAEPIADVALADVSDEDRSAMRSGGGLLAGHPVPRIGVEVVANRWGRPLAAMSRDAFSSMIRMPGAAGEIVVSGAHVIPGYLHGRGDEETKFQVDGVIWHRTGDLGYRDAGARLWLLGRCGADITDDKGTLYPFAVEAAVSDDPTVARSAVVQDGGGRRVLVIEGRRALQAGGPADTVDQQRIRKATQWARIDEVRLVRRIPVDRRHNAKVDYPALRRMLRR